MVRPVRQRQQGASGGAPEKNSKIAGTSWGGAVQEASGLQGGLRRIKYCKITLHLPQQKQQDVNRTSQLAESPWNYSEKEMLKNAGSNQRAVVTASGPQGELQKVKKIVLNASGGSGRIGTGK